MNEIMGHAYTDIQGVISLDDSLVQELNGMSYENFQNQGIQQEGY